MEPDEQTKCPHCGKTVRAGNFCCQCGGRLRRVCSPCLYLNKDSYECGYEKCPGWKIFILRARERASQSQQQSQQ